MKALEVNKFKALGDWWVKGSFEKAIQAWSKTYWYEMGFDWLLKATRDCGGSESKAIRYSGLMRLSPVDGLCQEDILKNILKAEQYYKAIAIG
jgi:hypothetical protein